MIHGIIQTIHGMGKTTRARESKERSEFVAWAIVIFLNSKLEISSLEPHTATTPAAADENIWRTFEQYNLQSRFLDTLVADVLRPVWRPLPLFDIIVADRKSDRHMVPTVLDQGLIFPSPASCIAPYGIREPVQTLKSGADPSETP